MKLQIFMMGTLSVTTVTRGRSTCSAQIHGANHVQIADAQHVIAGMFVVIHPCTMIITAQLAVLTQTAIRAIRVRVRDASQDMFSITSTELTTAHHTSVEIAMLFSHIVRAVVRPRNRALRVLLDTI